MVAFVANLRQMRGEAQTKPKFPLNREVSGYEAGNAPEKNPPRLAHDVLRMTRMFGKIAKLFRKSGGKRSEPAISASDPAAMPELQPLGRPKYAVPGIDLPVSAQPSGPAPVIDLASVRQGDSLALSYGAILHLVPKELHGKAGGAASSLTYNLPKAVALEQLPKGAVKVAFGDLRRAAPPGVFANSNTHDSKLVDLPLREILNQLNPEVFARRPAKNRLTAPDEVTDLFGSKGERLTTVRVMDKSELKATPRQASSAPAAPSTAAAPAAPTPAAEPAQPIRVNPSLAQQLQNLASMPAPIPGPGLKTPVPATPSAPVPAPATPTPMGGVPKLPVPPVPQIPKPAAPAPSAPAATPTLPPNAIKFPTPVVPKPAAPAPAPTPAVPTVPTPVVRAPAPSASTPGAATGGVLSISIGTVNQKWPEAIRKLVQQLGATDVEIPNELIEPALKAGKVEFPWQQVVTWLRPAPKGDVALDQADTVIELPLSVVAPLFLQQNKYKAKKSNVPEDIPDLFSSKGEKLAQEIEEEDEPEAIPAAPFAPPAPRPVAAAPAPARAAAPAPAAPAPPPAAPAPVAAAPQMPAARPDGRKATNLAELFGEPNKKNWTPNEIVHKTITLPGITGALIALQDGLLVAGCMPPPWKTETIAAFIPQIFGRLSQYTKELQMGEVRTVSFGVDEGTLQIFNAGIIYFGALGKHGSNLPIDELNLIASELSRHTK